MFFVLNLIRMNVIQKLILAIIIPIIILLLSYGFYSNFMIQANYSSFFSIPYHASWIDLEYTWWLWLLVVIIIGIIELLIFTKR